MNKMSIWAARRTLTPPRRVMRDPNEHGNQPDGGNNNPVNADPNANGGESGNNTGNEFDGEAFWRGPADEEPENPTPGGSVDPGNRSSGADDGANTLTQQLESLSFGNLFDDTIAGEINEGNYTQFNERVTGALRQGVQQSLLMNVQIMRQYGDRIIEQMREEMAGMFEGRDDQSQLVKDFPAAANPQVAPMIQTVFTQALKNTKGNRPEAVKQTKQMIALMAKQTGGDLDLTVAPRSENDVTPTPTTNWLDELMERK